MEFVSECKIEKKCASNEEETPEDLFIFDPKNATTVEDEEVIDFVKEEPHFDFGTEFTDDQINMKLTTSDQNQESSIINPNKENEPSVNTINCRKKRPLEDTTQSNDGKKVCRSGAEDLLSQSSKVPSICNKLLSQGKFSKTQSSTVDSQAFHACTQTPIQQADNLDLLMVRLGKIEFEMKKSAEAWNNLQNLPQQIQRLETKMSNLVGVVMNNQLYLQELLEKSLGINLTASKSSLQVISPDQQQETSGRLCQSSVKGDDETSAISQLTHQVTSADQHRETSINVSDLNVEEDNNETSVNSPETREVISADQHRETSINFLDVEEDNNETSVNSPETHEVISADQHQKTSINFLDVEEDNNETSVNSETHEVISADQNQETSINFLDVEEEDRNETSVNSPETHEDNYQEKFTNVAQSDIQRENKETMTSLVAASKKCTKNRKISPKTGKFKYKRLPKRPCFYCPVGKWFSCISDHLKNIHKDEAEVKEALSCKNRKKQNEMFSLLRKKGIDKYNRIAIKIGLKLITEKTLKSKFPAIKCDKCAGYYSSKCFFLHSNRCLQKKNKRTSIPKSCIPASSLKKKFQNLKLNEDFIEFVSSGIQKDEVGSFALNNETIMMMGNHFHCAQPKRGKPGSTKKSTSNYMRTIAKLFLTLKSVALTLNKEITEVREMFYLSNYTILQEAINKLVYDDEQLKHGALHALQWHIFKAREALCDHYRPLEKEVEKINLFYDHFKKDMKNLTGEVSYEPLNYVSVTQKTPNVCPKDFAHSLLQFITSEMRCICHNNTQWDHHIYIQLRRCLIAYLIAFNGSRPADVISIKIAQWETAKRNCYISEEHMNQLTYKEKSALFLYKIIDNSPKNSKKPICIVVPDECYVALNLLSNPKIRRRCKINEKNEFVFASSGKSPEPKGTHFDFTDVCFMAGLPRDSKMYNTKMRTLITSEFSKLTRICQKRDLFLRHFGRRMMNKEKNKFIPALANAKKIVVHLRMINRKFANMKETLGKVERNEGDGQAKRKEEIPAKKFAPVKYEELGEGDMSTESEQLSECEEGSGKDSASTASGEVTESTMVAATRSSLRIKKETMSDY